MLIISPGLFEYTFFSLAQERFMCNFVTIAPVAFEMFDTVIL